MDVVQLSANTWILLNTHLFFYYLLSIFYVFLSLTLAAASPTCPSPAPWVYLMQRDGGAWCWWIGKRQGEQEQGEIAHQQSSELLTEWLGSSCSPLQGGYNFCRSKRVKEKSYDEGRELRKGLETVPGCLPAVLLLICLLNKQPQIGTLAQPFGGISNFPAPRAHRPHCGSNRDLEVMPALPSRGMCWKLAALIYQSPAEGISRSAGLKISQFLSQQSCVWCTTEMRCEHTQHSPDLIVET